MSGRPLEIAKSLLQQLAAIAKKEKRSCFLISFSIRTKTLDLARPSNYYKIDKFFKGSVYGVVEKTINFDKDESWNDAVIIRTDKERIYVPVYQLHKENLEGKTVSISAPAGGLKKQISERNIRVVNDKSYGFER